MLVLAAAGAWLLGSAAGEIIGSRLLGIGIITLLVGLAWLDHHMEVRSKRHYWGALAQQTGLECTVRSVLFSTTVSVSGSYRGYPITMYTPRQGKGQIISTRIELTVPNRSRATLRMRGPFQGKQVAIDKVTRDLFATVDARQFGDDRRFFMRSQPMHLATTLLASPLWQRLLALQTLSNIELENQRLSFEQLGLLYDVEHLRQLLDVLCDMADLMQQRDAIWHDGHSSAA
jgi:hypothetical protein